MGPGQLFPWPNPNPDPFIREPFVLVSICPGPICVAAHLSCPGPKCPKTAETIDSKSTEIERILNAKQKTKKLFAFPEKLYDAPKKCENPRLGKSCWNQWSSVSFLQLGSAKMGQT